MSKRRRTLVTIIAAGLALFVVGVGFRIAHAEGNPFSEILAKLNQVLEAIGSIQEGNHTLRWDSNHPSASRFVTAFPGAVLDKNTGLVWEQAPDTGSHTWIVAIVHCVRKNVGGTVGWRLPSVVELKSLQDPSLLTPFVPAGVFTGIQTDDAYWAATTLSTSSTEAWSVRFFGIAGGGGGGVLAGTKSVSLHAWCVRGPTQESVY